MGKNTFIDSNTETPNVRLRREVAKNNWLPCRPADGHHNVSSYFKVIFRVEVSWHSEVSNTNSQSSSNKTISIFEFQTNPGWFLDRIFQLFEKNNLFFAQELEIGETPFLAAKSRWTTRTDSRYSIAAAIWTDTSSNDLYEIKPGSSESQSWQVSLLLRYCRRSPCSE